MESVPTGKSRSAGVNRQRIGRHYERLAQRYLQQQGLQWIASNVYTREGEIDLIMRDKHCWVIVEVRFRRNNRFGSALASVTPNKQRKLRSAAAAWLMQQGGSFDTTDIRFDIVAFTGSQLTWLVNAFNNEIETR